VTRQLEAPDAAEESTATATAILSAGSVASLSASRLGQSADELLKSRLLSGTGASVGRFVVESHLDEGGMGLIFTAIDEELDRPVALKILRAQQSEGSLGRARLIREAQVLAKLSHPNVVTVYEVGEWQGHVFVAMELIDGDSLRAWLRGRTRSRSEILGMFVQAGRGLAAAHKAGIIHRDFKPSNVIVGTDGRVRVLDFGIALAPSSARADARLQVAHEQGDVAASSSSRSTTGGAIADSLTAAGTIVGTVPYMAPEQLAGAVVDARADQYAFCVALYEGLYGRRPFAGRSLAERTKELASGVEVSFGGATTVPKWLRRILRRGLRSDPAERYATMDELVAELENDPTRRRRWIAVGALASSLLLAGGYSLARQDAAVCREGALGLRLEEGPRAAIEASLRGIDKKYVDEASLRLFRTLDDYAESWSEARTEACVSHQAGAHDAQLYGLIVGCMSRRRSAFDALAGALAEADSEILPLAIQAAQALPSIETCGDMEALTSEHPPPEDPKLAAEVRDLQEKLALAEVELRLERHGTGLEITTPIVARARELDYPPIEAEALTLHGRLLQLASDFEGSEEALRRGLWRADRIHDDELLALAMTQLILVIGESRGDYERAIGWREHAETVSERLGEETPGTANLLLALGKIAIRHHETAESIELCSRALAIMESLYGVDQPETSGALMGLAIAHASGHHFDLAKELMERTLRIEEEQLGPKHPVVAHTLGNLGALRGMSGDYAGASELLLRALTIIEDIHGPDHPSVGHQLGNIGSLYEKQDKPEQAISWLRRALVIYEKAFGAEHVKVAMIHYNVGDVYTKLGEDVLAEDHFIRAQEVFERKLSPDAPDLVAVILELGALRHRTGRTEEGLEKLERAYALSAKRPESVDTRVRAGYTLASIYRESKRPELRARAQELATEVLGDFDTLEEPGDRDVRERLTEWAGDPDR